MRVREQVRGAFILIIFSICTSYGFSQRLPDDDSMLTGKLDNGLTYYIKANDNPENQIEIRLVINAGSLYEEDSEQGFAHFVEHMCFNGTKNFPGNEAISYLESKGMRFGRQFNALTSFAETKYMLSLTDPDEELLENSFQIIEDWAHQVSFEDVEIEKERGVIIQELRTSLGAETRLREQFYPAIFRGSLYQYRLPIGKKEILESFEPDELREFYNKWYRPERMAVIIVGDIEKENALELLKSHFAHIRNDHPTGKIPNFEVANNETPVFQICTDSEASKELIRIYYLDDPGSLSSYDDLRTDLKDDLIKGMITKRLREVNQSTGSPFIYSNPGIGKLVRTKDAFTYTGLVKSGSMDDALKVLLTENQRLYLYGFTPSEFDLEKKIRSKELETNAAKTVDSKRVATRLMENFLNQEPAVSSDFIYRESLQLLQEITLDEVNELLIQWIGKDPIIVVSLTSLEGAPELESGGLEKIYRSIMASKPEKYIPGTTGESLVAEIDEPGKVVDEEVLEKYNITKWTLSNGARVILKPTDFKNDEVLFSAYSIGGTSQYPVEDFVSANFAVSSAFMSGLMGMSFPELRSMMQIEGVRLGPWLNEYGEGIRGSTDTKGVESLLNLNYLYFNELKADSTAAESYLSRRKSQIEAMKNGPDYLFSDTISRTLYGPNDRRFILSDTENYELFDLDRANEIARERFEDPSGFTFVLTGSFDRDEIKPLVEKYIGGMKGPSKSESVPEDTHFSLKNGGEIYVYSGQSEKSQVDVVFFGELPWNINDRATATVMTEVLKIKLRESLREDKSGVYGISVSSEADIIPENYFKFEIFFQCSTTLVDTLVEEVFTQLEYLKKEGPDKETLDKVKRVLNSEYSQEIKKNKYWRDHLIDIYGNEKDIDMELSEYMPAVLAVSARDVQGLARKKLKKSNVLVTKMYPEQSEK